MILALACSANVTQSRPAGVHQWIQVAAIPDIFVNEIDLADSECWEGMEVDHHQAFVLASGPQKRRLPLAKSSMRKKRKYTFLQSMLR